MWLHKNRFVCYVKLKCALKAGFLEKIKIFYPFSSRFCYSCVWTKRNSALKSLRFLLRLFYFIFWPRSLKPTNMWIFFAQCIKIARFGHYQNVPNELFQNSSIGNLFIFSKIYQTSYFEIARLGHMSRSGYFQNSSMKTWLQNELFYK